MCTPSTPLTVADVVVSVADAQVAPTVLHAVAAIRALGVHVAGRGCDFCAGGRSPVSGLPRDLVFLTRVRVCKTQ